MKPLITTARLGEGRGIVKRVLLLRVINAGRNCRVQRIDKDGKPMGRVFVIKAERVAL